MKNLVAIVIAAAILAAALCAGGCGPGAAALEPEKAVQALADSVAFDNETGALSFAIPKGLPPEYSYYIHASGRIKMGDGGMSFHIFEQESESNSWAPGKTYSHKLEKDSLLEAWIIVGLLENGNPEILFEKQVDIDENGNIDQTDMSVRARQTVVTFPASDEGKTEFNAAIYEIEPFNLSIELPDGWMLRGWEPDKGFDFLPLFSKLLVLDGNGECLGVIGYTTYEPYEGAEDNPQAIYGHIALGNDYQFDVRNNYRVVSETDSGTTAIVDVYYSASINSGAEKLNKGIVSYNKDLLVYIAMELDGGRVSDGQAADIADSMNISR